MNQTPAQGDAPAREGDAPRAPPTPSSTHILASIMPHDQSHGHKTSAGTSSAPCATTSTPPISQKVFCRACLRLNVERRAIHTSRTVGLQVPFPNAAPPPPTKRPLSRKASLERLLSLTKPSPLLLSNTSTAFGSHCTVLKTSAKLQRQPGQA